ncbi:MAG: nicotinate (nicotinamide) nucleotide adenylyltransferase [Betaproteobacteria bacterium]
MSIKARRIGLFGGAFDPPHSAHVAIARAALEQLELDELRILPTGLAWHKARALTAAADRLAMVRLAFGDLPGVVIDERELQRTGASYTIDTLNALLAEQPGSEIYLVMGGDQWAAFSGWRQWQDISHNARLCVAQRPDQAPAQQHPGLAVQWLRLPAMPISASAIRARLAGAAQLLDDPVLLPPAVARYISDHHLYAAG